MALIWKVNGKTVSKLPVQFVEADYDVQKGRVWKIVKDGKWHTLAEISAATGDPQPSVSARLRDFRKAKFGGHEVLEERLFDNTRRYKVIPRA